MTRARSAPEKRRRSVPFHRVDVRDEDVDAVVGALRSGWLTHGPLCRSFEQEFAAATGAARAVTTSSGTAAMYLALVALGVGEGHEVITTPLTFCSTVHVIEHCGARPVFVDVEPVTLQIDPGLVGKAIGPATAAIMAVDFGGHPCDLTALTELGDAHGVPVVEDAAHSFGALHEGRPVGSIVTATCFSFYATKNITTGEGGMVTTDDAGLADEVELLRLHGISRDAWRRYGEGGDWYYEVTRCGFKANLTDLQAALGLSQLRRAEEMRARRAAIAARYCDAFAALDHLLQVPEVSPSVRPAWHLYPLRLRLESLDVDRAGFIRALADAGVGTSVHFIPVHLHPYQRDRYGYARGDFPEAERAYDRLVSLPLYPAMSDDDVAHVVDAVVEVATAHAR